MAKLPASNESVSSVNSPGPCGGRPCWMNSPGIELWSGQLTPRLGAVFGV